MIVFLCNATEQAIFMTRGKPHEVMNLLKKRLETIIDQNPVMIMFKV